MAKHPGRDTRLKCQVQGCQEVPALGSDYCMRHHAEFHRAVPKQSKLIWLWIVLAGGGVAWFALNFQQLLGVG